MSRRIVILTWVSASWKTTLQNELLNRWWVRPINFSTRKARTEDAYEIDEDWDYYSDELLEYVFLDKKTFARKLINGDFIESTQYWWNLYWVSKHSFLEWDKDLIVILDPVWRAQVMEALTRMWVPFETYFIHIDENTQLDRLSNRWDAEEEIIKRKRDFDWFHLTNKCVRLNGKLDAKTLADIIENK